MHASIRLRLRFTSLLAAAWVLLSLTTGPAADEPKPADDAGVEFFEKNVRPILVKHCYTCHSADAEKTQKLNGALLLDTRNGLLPGGSFRTAT